MNYSGFRRGTEIVVLPATPKFICPECNLSMETKSVKINDIHRLYPQFVTGNGVPVYEGQCSTHGRHFFIIQGTENGVQELPSLDLPEEEAKIAEEQLEHGIIPSFHMDSFVHLNAASSAGSLVLCPSIDLETNTFQTALCLMDLMDRSDETSPVFFRPIAFMLSKSDHTKVCALTEAKLDQSTIN